MPAAKPPKAVLVYPRSAPINVGRLVEELRLAIEELGLTIAVFTTNGIPADRDWKRGTVQALSPAHAEELYRLLHHGPVAVAGFGRSYVRRDPRRTALNAASAIDLRDFVAHKAFVQLIGARPDIARFGPGFSDWRGETRCTGISDPRVLPFQTFTTARPWPELSSEAGRSSFNSAYGAGARRTDDGKRKWNVATAMHGHAAPSTVARRELPQGAHWDVQFQKASLLYAANEVWQVPRRTYMNVYPDGGLRGGSRDVPSARRLWP